ncbi:MAG: hypothetical protein ACRDV9_04545 [Acidimicrobiia bacterium]
MAGKVKKKDDAVQSKTARASMRTGSGNREAYNAAPDVTRIVPLGLGTHAYVLDPRDGRTLHLEVSSERFVEVLGALVEAGHGDLVRRELAALATRFPAGDWKDAVTRLDSALGAA